MMHGANDDQYSTALLLRQAIEETIEGYPGRVADWMEVRPKAWGFLAGKAVMIARRLLSRDLSQEERSRIWSGLWARLEQLRAEWPSWSQ